MRALRLLGAVALLFAERTAAANPSEDLARARAEYENGAYQRTIDILRPHLYPRPLIGDETELKEAHRLLGISYFFLERKDLAADEFLALLLLDPKLSLDPVLEQADVYAFFETVKTENRKALEELSRIKEQEAQKKRQAAREITIVREIRYESRAINWAPFGIPQRRNGQPTKATILMGTQALFGGVSLVAWTTQLARYGFSPTLARNAPERDTIRQLQIVQVGTGALALVAYAYGVIDAYANQKPRVVEHKSERQLGAIPLLSPGAVGVGATWEF
jgi:tetratricopeptide (TPR) repeat protein